MEFEYKTFLEMIIKENMTIEDVKNLAKLLLEDEFENEVKKLWSYEVNYSLNFLDNRFEFISYHCLSNEQKEFIMKNWDKVDEIIKIIKGARNDK